jgi:hypothetical protein
MKATLLTLIVFGIVLSSHTTKPKADVAANQIALQIISALHKSSALHYTALCPGVDVFQKLMDDNSALYGPNLEDAKKAFATEYSLKVIPRVQASFESVLQQGRDAGIDWKKIKFEAVESVPEPKDFSMAPISIIFSFNNSKYKLDIRNAIYSHAQWKVSHDLKLAAL